MYRMVISLIIMLLVAIFSVQNKDVVSVVFLMWNLQIPLVILVLSSVTLGAVLAGFLGVFRQIVLGKKIRDHANKIRKLEDENSTLQREIQQMADKAASQSPGEPSVDESTPTV